MKKLKTPRSLRLMVFLVIGASMSLFIVILFFIVQNTMSAMLLQSETSYLNKQLEVVDGILTATRKNLKIMTKDLAHWDETVRFAAGENPGYVESNWPGADILNSYRFSFIVIKDRDGNDLYVDFYDQIDEVRMEGPAGLTSSLNGIAASVLERYEEARPAEESDERIGAEGILFHDGQPYDICTMPVVVVGETELPTGTITFGNVLDDEYFQNLTHFGKTSFTIEPMDDVDLDKFQYQSADEQHIFAATQLYDIDGQAIRLGMRVNRAIYVQGRDTIRSANVLLLIACAVFIAVVYAVIIRRVLHPVEWLSEEIAAISSTGSFNPRWAPNSREFDTLITSIRDMLGRLDDSVRQAEQSKVSINVLLGILNGIDACLYVSDPETDEILFINDKMREEFGLGENSEGMICWKVLQEGMEERCSFCPVVRLTEGGETTVVWEEHNSATGRHYRNNDHMIPWIGGRQVHMQHSVDLTEEKRAQEAFQKRLEQQELMSDMSQSFISLEDSSTLILHALQMVGEFMNAGKILLAALNKAGDLLEIRYDWYNEEQDIIRLKAHAFPFVPGDAIYDAFVTGNEPYLVYNDIENVEEFAHFRLSKVKAFMAVPVYVQKEFWGVLSIDECVCKREWDASDIHLAGMISSVIAGVLLRSRTEESLTRMSSIVESSPQYIAYTNAQGGFEYMNRSVFAITGYSEEELLAAGIDILFEEEARREIHGEIIPQILANGTHNFELPLIRKDGSVRIMAFSAFRTSLYEGGIGAIASDITEKRQLEKELIAAKEQAESSSRAKGDFLSRMSHEMRTPMNAIIGMTSIAKNTLDIGKKDYCLDKIDDASVHLLGVINDILDMSKIEADKFELSDSEFSFEKMLLRVVNVVNFRIEEKNQEFLVKLDKDTPQSLIGDEQRLAQVITNLLSNAVKFTPDHGTITLSTQVLDVSGGFVTLQIAVDDTGIGITPEQQSRLFRSFEQADGGISRKFGGTGLGLAISKRIVEMMGGDIKVESAEGKGSRFYFHIRAQIGSATRKSLLGPNVDWKNLRVLAVDDSPEIREYFVEVMDSVGLKCAVAADGNEALRLVGQQKQLGEPYNILFIDWQMPGMNGIELTRKIRAEFGKNTVVIMISATEWAEIEKEAKQVGVDRFIPKPLFASVLVDCINECIGTGHEEVPGDQDYTDRFAGCRILLAEDIEINREIVMALLDSTGVEIECAENGREALELFQKNPSAYDMIFMDIHMPEMSGYESARLIRALDDPKAAEIPIVAMTANVFREDVERCLAAGMNDHIGKPIDMDTLYQKLVTYLKR